MAKIALLGIGTVGGGVARLLTSNASQIAGGAGEEIELKYILCSRPHPDSPFADKLIYDFSEIESDPEVSVVAECIGGVGSAYDYAKRALKAGKSVVTSNKELIAEKGPELLSLAAENGARVLFEASVGGGIPIIRPLTQCLAANRVDEIYGILNGTTNYILTQMIQCSQSFDEALHDAQRLGYAESDPTADVEGLDAGRKICILADICFGHHVPPEKIRVRGITGITANDAVLAERLGMTVKLLGRARRVGGRLAVSVSPHMIGLDKMLANISGVMNGICVKGDAVGECLFYGAGAGSLPTASAVVADIIDAVRRAFDGKCPVWGEDGLDMLLDPDELPCRWYVRAEGEAAVLESVFGGAAVSVDGMSAVIAGEMSRSEIDDMCAGLGSCVCFPVLD